MLKVPDILSFLKNPFVPLERRIILLLLAAGIILGLTGNLTNIILGLPSELILAGFAIEIILIYFFIKALREKERRDYSKTLVFSLLIFLPVQWILNGGRDSNTVSLYFLILTLMFFGLSEKFVKIFTAVLLTELVVLNIIDEYFTHIIVPYSNTTQRFVDLVTGNTLYFIILFIVLFLVRNTYKFQIERGSLQNKYLRKLNDEVSGKNATIRAINDRLDESEKRTRLILDTIPAVVIVILEEKIAFINKGGIASLGVSKDLITGKEIYTFIEPASRDIVRENIARNFRGEEVKPYEITVFNIRGEGRIVMVTQSPVKYNEQDALLAILSDITALKEKEEVLQTYSRKLEKADAAKARFISILSHDLRSPFQGLLGLSEILSEQIESLDHQHAKEFASLLSTSLHAQYDLLNDILTWSRFQTDSLILQSEDFNLRSMVRSIEELYDITLNRKSLHLQNLVPESVMFRGDKKMIALLIRNLVGNAIKFSKSGQEIFIRYDDTEEGRKISVSDTGTGISPENLGKILKFETGFTTRGTEGEKGTGLGLNLCKEICERHGGTIRILSEAGSGTTVEAVFPMTS